ncbi:MAG TPA: M20/M25/M40 family metallo-hydrolase [Steroidobacteraceae bacterium]|nr:M20/M25/M40 family metallo-hydrolase [Steroidobacteraceae bacterium]
MVAGLLLPGMLYASPGPPAQYESLATDILRELIEIDSVEPAGSLGCVKAIVARLRAGGFAPESLRILAPPEHPEKANLVVRVPGRAAGKPLLWTAHLDVVAADPSNWTVPPFKLTQSGGWYYGRGTGDMKGEVAALVTALMRLKSQRIVPRHDLIVAFTADEEAAGHANGVKWLLASHPQEIEAGVAFNPDTGGSWRRGGRPLLFGIETAEKTYATYILEATGTGGHSSQPEPDNAIYRLSAAVLRVGEHRFPVRLTPAARDFLAVDADLEPSQIANDIRAVLAMPPDADAATRLSARPDLDAQLRTTCVATLISGGTAENALPPRAEATVQCRLLPGDSAESVRQILQEVAADSRLSVALARPVFESPETVPDPRITSAIASAVHGMWPEVRVLLNMQAGGSDAVFTRAAGIATYGVTSIFSDLGENRHHGGDERISKEAFREGVEFTYRFMRQVDEALDPVPGRAQQGK